MLKKNLYQLLIMALLAITLVCSCGKDDDAIITPDDMDAADTFVGLGNTALETVLENVIGNMENPEDLDLSAPYNLYLQAIAVDVDHPAANFGAGIIELMMLYQDVALQDMSDRLNGMSDFRPFEISGGSLFSIPQSGIVLNASGLSVPILAPLAISSEIAQLDSDIVTIGEIRELVLNTILPKLNVVIDRLNIVTSYSEFVFIVTPGMQGDPNEDQIEIDLTEVYATLTGLEVFNALLNQMFAYNYEFTEYTQDEMLTALTPGSDFLALYDNGEGMMATAHRSWTLAVNHLENGINFLQNETDDQSNDVIKIDPYDGITSEGINETLEFITVCREALTTGTEIGVEDDETLTLNLNQFFNDPVQDYKTIFPGYTSSVIEGELQDIWESLREDSDLEITIDHLGSAAWTKQMRWVDGVIVNEWEDIRNFDYPEIEEIWNQMVTDYFVPQYDNGIMQLSCYFNPDEIGTISVPIRKYIDYSEGIRKWTPVITWDANTFDEWIFPNPTLNGALPDMTDERIKSLFGMDASSWEQVITLDW
jgi:hypothetical protein